VRVLVDMMLVRCTGSSAPLLVAVGLSPSLDTAGLGSLPVGLVGSFWVTYTCSFVLWGLLVELFVGGDFFGWFGIHDDCSDCLHSFFFGALCREESFVVGSKGDL
jgi:hypothetical protein